MSCHRIAIPDTALTSKLDHLQATWMHTQATCAGWCCKHMVVKCKLQRNTEHFQWKCTSWAFFCKQEKSLFSTFLLHLQRPKCQLQRNKKKDRWREPPCGTVKQKQDLQHSHSLFHVSGFINQKIEKANVKSSRNRVLWCWKFWMGLLPVHSWNHYKGKLHTHPTTTHWFDDFLQTFRRFHPFQFLSHVWLSSISQDM